MLKSRFVQNYCEWGLDGLVRKYILIHFMLSIVPWGDAKINFRAIFQPNIKAIYRRIFFLYFDLLMKIAQRKIWFLFWWNTAVFKIWFTPKNAMKIRFPILRYFSPFENAIMAAVRSPQWTKAIFLRQNKLIMFFFLLLYVWMSFISAVFFFLCFRSLRSQNKPSSILAPLVIFFFFFFFFFKSGSRQT